jgi:tetratricopeptide (TPR) repeat protein
LLLRPQRLRSEFRSGLEALALTSDARRAAFAGGDGRMRIVDTASEALLQCFPSEPQPRVWRATFSRDGRLLATADKDRTLRVWIAEAGELRHTLSASGAINANGLAFSPDNSRLASLYGTDIVQLWNMADGTLVAELDQDRPYSLDFHPTKPQLAVGGFTGVVALWDLATNSQVARLSGHRGPVLWVAWNTDGSRLVSTGADATVKVWDPMAAELLLSLDGPVTTGTGVAFSSDGRRLVSVYDDRTLRLWDGSLLSHRWTPDEWRLTAARGHALLEQGRWEQAATEFGAALDRAEEDSELWRDRARATALAGDFAQALADFNRAVDALPDDGGVWLGRSVARALAGRTDEAENDFRQAEARASGAVALDASYPWRRRDRAYALQVGSWELVAQDVSQLLDAQPNEATWRLHRARGLARAVLGEYLDAEHDFAEAARLAPNESKVWLPLARCLAEQSKWDVAESACAKAVEHDPQSWAAWHLRGVCRRYLDRHAEATSDLTQARDLAPTLVAPAVDLALLLANQGDITSANAALADLRAAQRSPEGKAGFELAQGYYDVAGVALDRLSQGDDGDAAAAHAAACAAVELLELLAAAESTGARQRLLALALFRRGEAEAQLDRRETAEETYALALDAAQQAARFPEIDDPRADIATACGRLARVHLRRLHVPSAIAADEQRLAIARQRHRERDMDATRDALATALGNLSFDLLFVPEAARAIELAEEALRLAPGETWIAGNLATAYLLSDRFDEAWNLYRELRTERVNDQTFAEAALEDFRRLREAGVTHPDMAKVEEMLAALQTEEESSSAASTPAP